MKGLFQKLLREKAETTEEKKGERRYSLSHLNSYKQVQKRSLIGWIVAQCAAALHLEDEKREALFFMALTTENFEQIEDEMIRELMQLGHLAVEWIDKNAIIEEEMKSIQPTFLSKELMNRVFNNIQ